MACFLGCIALVAPRLTIVLVVIFSDYIGRAYETMLWPVVGFLFAWDPDFTLMHLFSALFATASVVLPVLIWYHILADDILDDAGSYFVGLLTKLSEMLGIDVVGIGKHFFAKVVIESL